MNQYSPMGFRLMPPAVKNLLIINVIMFLGTEILRSKFNFDLTQYLGLYFPDSEYFKPYQLISHLFMHGSLMHIFSNMFALWMFGAAIENVWGTKRFLFFFIFTGLGAAGLHLLISWYRFGEMHDGIIAYQNAPSPEAFHKLVIDYFPEYKSAVSGFINEWTQHPLDTHYLAETNNFIRNQFELRLNIPTVGASGAVFGILLAFGMLFPNTMIYLYFFFPLKAKYFVFLYGIFELYSGVMNQPGDNIAHFAHIGGMLFGFILIKYWQNNKFKKMFK
ncbi:MAG: rhomboid family intramembrane serine protease [Bacteroidetes bacterium CG23_combo_of_CG06-09_8_20_14_all_32_9]|nr:MAG: rhomboid family intramembrane serine protease [Bacteroidetes bacterium CG23_combo_of_CG06-09_8_20_14_all_32_9]